MTAPFVFVSVRRDFLPNWLSAFADADADGFEGRLLNGARPRLAWVRLRPGRPAAQELAAVRERLGDVPLIALSDRPDDDEALACFAAAARGYCNSHAAPAVLRHVAEVALQGGLWIGESLMQRLLQATARMPQAPASAAPAVADWTALLTERERQVAEAVASGASNKEIASRYAITERTVKAHVGAVLEKLGVRDRLQLALAVNGRRVK